MDLIAQPCTCRLGDSKQTQLTSLAKLTAGELAAPAYGCSSHDRVSKWLVDQIGVSLLEVHARPRADRHFGGLS